MSRIIVVILAIALLTAGLFGPANAEPNKPEGGGVPPKSRIILHVNVAELSYQFYPDGRLRTDVMMWDSPAVELVFTFYFADGSVQTFLTGSEGENSWGWCADLAVDSPQCVATGVDVAFASLAKQPFVSMRWDTHVLPGPLLRYERDSYGRGKIWVENDSAQQLFYRVGSTMVPFEIGEELQVNYRPSGAAAIYSDPAGNGNPAASVKWLTVQSVTPVPTSTATPTSTPTATATPTATPYPAGPFKFAASPSVVKVGDPIYIRIGHSIPSGKINYAGIIPAGVMIYLPECMGGYGCPYSGSFPARDGGPGWEESTITGQALSVGEKVFTLAIAEEGKPGADFKATITVAP